MIDYSKLEYVNIKLEKIDDAKKEKFENFIDTLKIKDNKKEAIVSYRGTGYKKVKKELHKYTTDYIGKSDIYERLFLIGQKSSFAKARKINPNKRDIYEDGINDCSEIVLDDLFTQLSKILKEERLEKKVEENISEEFKNYFLNEANRSNFIKNIDSQQEGNKLWIRDYYLYLLHTSNVMKEDSILVSTSTLISKARNFTSSALKDDKDIAVIFHYFICEPYIYHTFTPWKMEKFDEFEKNISTILGFPTYNAKGLFPEQNEVAIKGGLFPHNIFGIELVKEKKFIVNPHLFVNYNNPTKLKNIQWSKLDKQLTLIDFNDLWIELGKRSNDIETIFKYGRIFIDQSTFDEVIKDAEYEKKIYRGIDGLFSEEVKY